MPQTLARLPLSHPATLRAIHGDRPFRRRLMELGLLPGTTVEVTRVAPLGDPLELQVRGCRLSIRRRDAEAVELQPLALAAK